jgi:hypothetical protein
VGVRAAPVRRGRPGCAALIQPSHQSAAKQ